jgi:hypothetical protein
MTFTYGFYDSVSSDRLYTARQFGQLFDGLIYDGVYEDYGDHFEVVEDSGMNILIKSGRAWFKSTWSLNDSNLSDTVPTADPLLPRIDIVYLEINLGSGVRANKIDIVTGTPASSPVPPTLTQSGDVWQYPLAHIYVGAGVTSISDANITNKMGTVDCPYVTGPVSGNFADHDHTAGQGGNIGSTGISNSAIVETKIADGAVTVNKIGSLAVSTAKIQSSAISAAKIASSAVEEAKIATGAVTNTKLGSNAVSEAKIADGAVTVNKIGSLAVSTAKIAANAVTTDKIPNRTRRIWFDLGSLYLYGASPLLLKGAHIDFDEDVDQWVAAQFPLPADFVSGFTVKIYPFAFTAATGTVVWDLQTIDVPVGTDLDVISFTSHRVEQSVYAANHRYLIEFSLGSWTVSAGDHCIFQLYRKGTDVYDNYDVPYTIAGIAFEYTADS